MRLAYVKHFYLMSIAIALISSFVFPSKAKAQNFGYAGIKGGYVFQKIEGIDLKGKGTQPSRLLIKPFSNSTVAFGANIGWGFLVNPSFGFRLEGEYLYRIGLTQSEDSFDSKNAGALTKFETVKTALQSQALLGNVYLDYYVIPSVSVYFSFGAGANLLNSKLEVSDTAGTKGSDKTSTASTSFSWQVGVGTAYAILENLWIDLNLRYVDLGNFKSKLNVAPTAQNTEANSKVRAFEALLGLNYRF